MHDERTNACLVTTERGRINLEEFILVSVQIIHFMLSDSYTACIKIFKLSQVSIHASLDMPW